MAYNGEESARSHQCTRCPPNSFPFMALGALMPLSIGILPWFFCRAGQKKKYIYVSNFELQKE